MSTIDTLLKTVAPDAVAPDAETVDADLARGRAALITARRRRTYRRLPAAVASLAAVGIVIAVAATSGGHSTSPARHVAATGKGAAPRVHIVTPGKGKGQGTGKDTGGAKPGSGPRVRLAAYSGDQLPGFTVSQLPQGWHLSTSVSTALLIVPDDGSVADNNPYDFVGKLAVLPQSIDQHGLGPGDPVTVNGQPGRVDAKDGPPGSLQLRYTTPDGHAVDIQSPTSLHWTAADIVAFAQGVTVTGNVGVTRG